MVYCVIPRDLAPRLHEHLRKHFHEDPGVEVVVERRGQDRRRRAERRDEAGAAAPSKRRKIRAWGGRRVADRRARLMDVPAPPLPRRARAHLDRLLFVERLEPTMQQAEDVDTARLVTRIQAGQRNAFVDLYMRYFDRVYGYLHVALKDRHEAEDVTQQVFMRVFESIPEYEQRRGKPFRAWLFIVVRNHAIKQLRDLGRLDFEDPDDLDRRREGWGEGESEELFDGLDWISDAELRLFVERLPLPQQQVLLLRYSLNLSAAEIAEILGREPADVRVLHHRALRFLHQRLGAVQAHGGGRKRVRWQLRPRHANVLRSRRFALTP